MKGYKFKELTELDPKTFDTLAAEIDILDLTPRQRSDIEFVQAARSLFNDARASVEKTGKFSDKDLGSFAVIQQEVIDQFNRARRRDMLGLAGVAGGILSCTVGFAAGIVTGSIHPFLIMFAPSVAARISSAILNKDTPESVYTKIYLWTPAHSPRLDFLHASMKEVTNNVATVTRDDVQGAAHNAPAAIDAKT